MVYLLIVLFFGDGYKENPGSMIGFTAPYPTMEHCKGVLTELVKSPEGKKISLAFCLAEEIGARTSLPSPYLITRDI